MAQTHKDSRGPLTGVMPWMMAHSEGLVWNSEKYVLYTESIKSFDTPDDPTLPPPLRKLKSYAFQFRSPRPS